MSLKLKLLCVVISIVAVSSVNIKCNHQVNRWTGLGPIQECLVVDLYVVNPNETVTSLNKHHYTTIKSFYVYKSKKFLHMPKGVEKFLEGLEVLVIAHTGLKEIKSSDLKPFELLKEIHMDNNQLEELESDLFIFNPMLRKVNFDNNKIKKIGCGILEPLKRLDLVCLTRNDFHIKEADNQQAVELMKIELKVKTCSNETGTSPTTTRTFDCEKTQSFIDLKSKVVKLEFDLKRTKAELTTTTNEFCVRYNDWSNEKCKEMETTTTMAHPEDKTEGHVEKVVNQHR